MNPNTDDECYYTLENVLLSSCQHLRTVFQARWKKETGKDWGSTELSGRQVIEGLGERIYESVPTEQKAVIVTGSLGEWDLATLSLVLQHFGKKKNLFKNENEAVKSLARLKSELDRNNPKKKLSREKYNQKLGLFKTSLQTLKIKQTVIKTLIERAGITSSATALELATKLYEEAEAHLEKEEFDNAAELYTKSLAIPSLLPVHLANAFKKRSECYYQSLVQQQKEKGEDVPSDCDHLYDKAIGDATKALELHEHSWNAYRILALCYTMRNDLKQAIYHYERALEFSPAKHLLKRDLETCKALVAGVARLTNYAPTTTVPEEIAVAEEIILDAPGQEEVGQGHEYKTGTATVPQNHVAAASCYAKGAELGNNPEGIYQLALCYQEGTGVEKDLIRTHQLYLQAAEMPSNTPGRMTKLKKNFGVCSAQHTLGWMHESGTFLEQNYSKAAEWYEKAASNGSGLSANNLGIFYNDGKGLPRDEKKAAEMLNKAVELGAANATSALMFYYIQQMEEEKAREMLKKARKWGFPH